MIPISQPLIAKNAKRYLDECLKTGWVSSAGSFVERFEKAFAAFVGTTFAIATNSGTSAIHLSLASLGVGNGDEIIVPSYTMIASVLPIIYQGATPVLIDSEKETGNIDVGKIEGKITKKTKAILPVHMFGHPVDMDPLLLLAKKYNLAIIEDAAESHGAQYFSAKTKKWKRVGAIGDAGCFSFYGNKIITTGEGGMMTTNNEKIAEKARSLRNLARTPGRHFLHREVAFAYRMSNLQAALGLAELEEIETYIRQKQIVAQHYEEELKDIPWIVLPHQQQYAKSVFWQYGIRLEKISVEKIEKLLVSKNIETRRFFVPMHKQPAFVKLGLFKNEHFPIAEKLQKTGLCIPSGVALSDKQLMTVVHVLKTVLL